MRMVADGIGTLARPQVQLGRGGNELSRDGIVGIAGVDQLDQRRRDRHGIARGNAFERRQRRCGASPSATSSAGSRKVRARFVFVISHPQAVSTT